ncbi:retropepsin-like aspartic protease, partial [Flavobacterium sp.]|uniref:retropepsin-like aspartic protease n=1 Tax=Flavobacterium sp. TaxID=239 RepID=UPI002622B4D1
MKKITFILFLLFFEANSLAQDTIPFVLGKNNKIYIKARINNSEELNFMFDTGADENAIKKSVLDKKATCKIDGKDKNIGIGGTHEVETSSSNTIQINSNSKTNQRLVVLDYEDDFEDGIIGWPFFENKVVNINYGIKK